VLAMAGRRYYAVPLTYRGQFERRARKFAGSRQLLTDARPGSVVCVTYLDRGENLPLSTGDRLRVLAGHDDHKLLYVRCERYPTSVIHYFCNLSNLDGRVYVYVCIWLG